jgi:hypothetical protein
VAHFFLFGFAAFGALIEEIALIFVTNAVSLSSAPDARASSKNLSCCDLLGFERLAFGIKPTLLSG